MHFRSVIAGEAAPEAHGDGPRAEPVILLIDADRGLIDSNRAAEALLDDAAILERSFGRLAARCQSDIVRIERALSEARRHGIAPLRLADGGFEADIVRMGMRRPEPGFLLLSRRRQQPCGAERMARRCGLTPAENRLLRCLIEGLALSEAALRLGVARTTARTHLQRIFDKTGVRRQTDLQRMIAHS